MQDSGYGYPPVENRSQGFPPLLGTLAAADEDIPPESIDALSEGAQLTDIPGNSMVFVLAIDQLPKPCTNLTDAIMLPAEKLNLDGLQLRNHSLFRCNPPDGEGIGLVASPAVVGEAQEREGLRFPLPHCFRLWAAWRPNSISRVFSGWSSKSNFLSRSLNSSRNRTASAQCWKPITRSST
jgi:hypothetical protein